MLSRIGALTAKISADVIAHRRDFHKHAETGWTEFRTASLIARQLDRLGLEVHAGRSVIVDDVRMGVPAPEVLDAAWQRAKAQGGDPAYLEKTRGGFTGVVGLLGGGEGPTVGLRFDIDALDLQESQAEDHRPAREGFASINEGAAHACGHDGHAALGLGVAGVLSGLADALRGRVKLIFQPAEEGVRGAKAMVAAGVVDDVDVMVGLHVHTGWPTGVVTTGRGGFLATDKLDAIFTGEAAHAGGSPQRGKNALLAAATAALNLHALPRHRDGVTRINVGRLVAGEGRNVIPPTAYMAIETRGGTLELAAYMREAARRVLESAAAMYGCSLEVVSMGSAGTAESDPALATRVAEVVERLPELSVRPEQPSGGSEDFTYMMQRVQQRGGLATSLNFGADGEGGGAHTATFDFDERALPLAVKLLAALVLDVQARPL
ncbi:MAG: amidohydrolase [Anaerolineae bacterium]